MPTRSKQEKFRTAKTRLKVVSPKDAPRKGTAVAKKRKKAENPENGEVRPTPDHLSDLSYEREVETLLNIASRKKLPQNPQRAGRKCLLIEMVAHDPDRYARLITFIRSGVSFGVAAEASGIGERTFYEWGQRGQQDLDEEADTFFSRFFKDVRRAVAAATADCEQHVKEMDPRKWLSHGPGRIFNLGWSEDVSKGTGAKNLPAPHDPQEQILDAAFTVRPKPALPAPSDPSAPGSSSSPEKTPDSFLDVPSSLEFEAFKVLENCGLISLTPEFKEAFHQQEGTDQDPADPQIILEYSESDLDPLDQES